jgi:hypothetical protein
VVRPRRVVRFARLIDRRGRVLGGPAVRAAFGGNLKPALVATHGGTGMAPSYGNALAGSRSQDGARASHIHDLATETTG